MEFEAKKQKPEVKRRPEKLGLTAAVLGVFGVGVMGMLNVMTKTAELVTGLSPAEQVKVFLSLYVPLAVGALGNAAGQLIEAIR